LFLLCFEDTTVTGPVPGSICNMYVYMYILCVVLLVEVVGNFYRCP